MRQIVHWIPPGLPDRLAQEADADIRTFSCASHIVALLYGQLNRAASLNEIRDAARLHEPELNRIRGATAPKRNTFSNANRTRDPAIAERLYWRTFEHLRKIRPDFTQAKSRKGFIHRVKRDIFAIDSTTWKLSLYCIDWARHRRKKAAAKTHLRLNIGNRLPAFAVVEDAAHHRGTLPRPLGHRDVLQGTQADAPTRRALRLYGIAGGPKRLVIVEYQRYFQGFERFTSRPVG